MVEFRNEVFDMGVAFVCKKCGRYVHLSGEVTKIKHNELCYECATGRKITR
jgi:hypothetical protein